MMLLNALMALAMAGEPRLPEVVYAAPAVYPEAELAAGIEASVLLRLQISMEGEVVGVELVEPNGSSFEQPAILAAMASRFTPAYDAEDQPSGAVIGYRIVFDVEIAPPISVEGTISDAVLFVPLDNVRIEARSSDGTVAFALTDEEGSFELAGLASGAWSLLATRDDLVPELTEIEVTDGSVIIAEILIMTDTSEYEASDLEIIIEAERGDSEVVERRITADEIQYLPGTGGDVVKVVQNLPGVLRSPLGTGNLYIRGTAPEDSATFLDGGPIPLVFHFAGLTSVVQGDSLEEVAFVPGNSSARYGRILGGVVDLRTTTGLPEEDTRFTSIDIFQASLFLEQRLGDSTALTIAGRRSYIDAILNPILNNMDSGLLVQAPRYYDAQLRLVHEGAATWDFMIFGSDDRFRFLGGGDDEVLAAYADRFLRARIRRLKETGDYRHETTFSVGPENRFFEQDDGDSEAFELDIGASLREEIEIAPTFERPVGFRAGLDIIFGEQSFVFDFGPAREEGKSLYLAPGGYVEATVQMGRLAVVPGLRMDGFGFANGYWANTIDPRLSIKYALPSSTLLKGAVGRYSSFPTFRQVDEDSDGSIDLLASRSLQVSLGAEQQIGEYLTVELAGYLNEMSDLVVGREDRLRFYSGPPPIGPFDTEPYANDGVGRSFGSELFVRYEDSNSTGMLSATWSNSTRQDRPDEEAELFIYDQPLVFTALWSESLPKDYRLGIRVRSGSGNPYTPVINRFYNLSSRTFVPVYGESSSGRLDPFFSLDLRIDKSWDFERWTLGGYLELQNATNTRSPELLAWNADYSEEVIFTSNPLLPVFGLRGDW